MSMVVPPVAVGRMTWMDVLRGAAIGLVIVWHSAGILILYDIAVPEVIVDLNAFFLPYRMPTLMFLSGMLLPASLRKPLPAYLVGKMRFIGYPLVIWTVIHYLIMRPGSTIYNLDFLTTSYLWFLVYLLAYYSIAPLVTRVPTWILVVSPLLVTPFVESDSRRRFFFLAAFFFLGALIAENRAVLERLLARRWIWCAAPLAVIFGIVSAVLDPAPYQGVLALFSLPGILVGIKLAMVAASKRWSQPVQFVGRNSLIFYATHFPIMILSLLVADRLLGWSVWALMTLGFAAALTLGALLARWSAAPPVRWAFVAPGERRSRVVIRERTGVSES